VKQEAGRDPAFKTRNHLEQKAVLGFIRKEVRRWLMKGISHGSGRPKRMSRPQATRGDG
jgi:hypothetical protein